MADAPAALKNMVSIARRGLVANSARHRLDTQNVGFFVFGHSVLVMVGALITSL